MRDITERSRAVPNPGLGTRDVDCQAGRAVTMMAGCDPPRPVTPPALPSPHIPPNSTHTFPTHTKLSKPNPASTQSNPSSDRTATDGCVPLFYPAPPTAHFLSSLLFPTNLLHHHNIVKTPPQSLTACSPTTLQARTSSPSFLYTKHNAQ